MLGCLESQVRLLWSSYSGKVGQDWSIDSVWCFSGLIDARNLRYLSFRDGFSHRRKSASTDLHLSTCWLGALRNFSSTISWKVLTIWDRHHQLYRCVWLLFWILRLQKFEGHDVDLLLHLPDSTKSHSNCGFPPNGKDLFSRVLDLNAILAPSIIHGLMEHQMRNVVHRLSILLSLRARAGS